MIVLYFSEINDSGNILKLPDIFIGRSNVHLMHAYINLHI